MVGELHGVKRFPRLASAQETARPDYEPTRIAHVAAQLASPAALVWRSLYGSVATAGGLEANGDRLAGVRVVLLINARAVLVLRLHHHDVFCGVDRYRAF